MREKATLPIFASTVKNCNAHFLSRQFDRVRKWLIWMIGLNSWLEEARFLLVLYCLDVLILLSGSLENSVGLEMIYEDEEEERQVSIVSQVDDRPGTSSGRQKKLMSSRYTLKPFQLYS